MNQNQIQFTTINGKLVEMTEKNTLITYYKADMKVDRIRTIKSFIRFYIAQMKDAIHYEIFDRQWYFAPLHRGR